MSASRHELETGKITHKPRKHHLKHSATILADP